MDYINAKNEVMTAQMQLSWEQTRWLGAIILQPHMKKGKSIKPTDLVAFPWEKKQKQISQEEEEKRKKEREAMFQKWDADIKKKTYGE
jgi:hypothetical protein